MDGDREDGPHCPDAWTCQRGEEDAGEGALGRGDADTTPPGAW